MIVQIGALSFQERSEVEYDLHPILETANSRPLDPMKARAPFKSQGFVESCQARLPCARVSTRIKTGVLCRNVICAVVSSG